MAPCSGILSLLIIFIGHDIILCAVFHHGLYIDGPRLFCIVRCMSKNSREDVWACVCTYVGLHVILNVIGMCMHVCELARGAYRILGVAWHRFVRRVGSGYLKKLMLGKQKGLLSSSLCCDGKTCSRSFFRNLRFLGLG